ncbi:hypothetical protein D9613_009669 [Agrocybe pediades]|uniref:Uncharacterized protein n=1 Tax=Agrocybe pediades TaxID=84607 RepID=A0A8H4VQH1_9AGAR|nr:hypothetical protein D9613_009669 [Agrocybe pediades]
MPRNNCTSLVAHSMMVALKSQKLQRGREPQSNVAPARQDSYSVPNSGSSALEPIHVETRAIKAHIDDDSCGAGVRSVLAVVRGAEGCSVLAPVNTPYSVGPAEVLANTSLADLDSVVEYLRAESIASDDAVVKVDVCCDAGLGGCRGEHD